MDINQECNKLYNEILVEDVVFKSQPNPIKKLYEIILSEDNNNFTRSSNTKYDNASKRISKFIISIQEDIQEAFNLVTIRETGEMFIYVNGEYVPHAETIIKEIIKSLLDSVGITSLSRYKYEQVIYNLKISSYINREDFVLDKRFIPLNNGVYDLENKILLKFNPKFFVTQKIKVDYNQKSKMEYLPAWLLDLLSNKQDLYDTMQEFFGYCLYRGYPLQKFLLIYGGGRNGKGVFLDVLKHFIGQNNISSVEIKDFENRFMPAELYKKLVNIAGDISDTKIKDVGIIKALTGGDLIKAEKKGKDPFYFVNHAKPIFSCNNLPRFNDDSVGMLRRFLLIPFEKEYIEGKNAVNKEQLIKHLTTKKELSGVLNWALEGLHRLLENNRFSNKSTVEFIRDKYEMEKNSVYLFLNNHVEVLGYVNESDKELIPTTILYAYYIQYCDNNNVKLIKNKIAFGRMVKKWNKYILSVPKWKNNKTQQCYTNIKIITNDLIMFDVV